MKIESSSTNPVACTVVPKPMDIKDDPRNVPSDEEELVDPTKDLSADLI